MQIVLQFENLKWFNHDTEKQADFLRRRRCSEFNVTGESANKAELWPTDLNGYVLPLINVSLLAVINVSLLIAYVLRWSRCFTSISNVSLQTVAVLLCEQQINDIFIWKVSEYWHRYSTEHCSWWPRPVDTCTVILLNSDRIVVFGPTNLRNRKSDWMLTLDVITTVSILSFNSKLNKYLGLLLCAL